MGQHRGAQVKSGRCLEFLALWCLGVLSSWYKAGGRDASAPGLTLLDYDGLYLTLTLKLLCSVGKKWYMVTSTRHASLKIDLGIH